MLQPWLQLLKQEVLATGVGIVCAGAAPGYGCLGMKESHSGPKKGGSYSLTGNSYSSLAITLAEVNNALR